MTPRTVLIKQCTMPGAWYEDLLFETFVVLERFGRYYIVDTWNGYGQCLPELIKISDCEILEP